MSTFAVQAHRLTILEHPNADALELAAVGGYRAVVAKGRYSTGDAAIYIPEQAIVPDALRDELGLTSRLAGKADNRVKAVRLRGELSQGIVCQPASLEDVDLLAAADAQVDFAERLGITKWVPEIPASMSGQVVPAPNLIPWIEVENIKRFLDVFEPGEPVRASEKTHGTCCVVTVDITSDEVFVSSKGFAHKRLAIVEDANNVYWRAVRHHDVEAAARRVGELLGAVRIGLFAEVFGTGIQDLHYGVASRNEPGYALFDAKVVTADGLERWLEQSELEELFADTLRVMPTLYDGPYDYDALCALAEGTETISGTQAHLREGVVVRATPERRSDRLGGRAIVKFVSSAYLVRKNATEYE